MAVIQKEVRLVGSKGKREELALFDSGATYSCLRPDIARELGNVENLPEPMEFGTVKDGEKVTTKECVRREGVKW